MALRECACLQAAGATSVHNVYMRLALRSTEDSLLSPIGQRRTQAHLMVQPSHERHTAAAAIRDANDQTPGASVRRLVYVRMQASSGHTACTGTQCIAQLVHIQ